MEGEQEGTLILALANPLMCVTGVDNLDILHVTVEYQIWEFPGEDSKIIPGDGDVNPEDR